MNSKIHTLLLALLVSATLCTLKVNKGIPQGTVSDQDLIELDLGEVFDLSDTNLDLTTFAAKQTTGTAQVGKIYTYLTPFFTKPLTDVTQVNFVKFIDETSYVTVHDNNMLMYTQTSLDRSAILSTWAVNLGKFGADVICQDVFLSPNLNDIYVGCSARVATPIPAKDNMYLVLVDRNAQSVLTTVHVNMTEGFDITNELRLQLLDVDSSKSEHVLVYNQGRTNAKTTRYNMDFMIFKRIGSELHPAESNITTYHIQSASNTTEFTAIYDIFPLTSDHIVVSGRRKGSEASVTLSSCAVDVTEADVICSAPVDVGLGTGKIDITSGTGLLSILDYDSKLATIYTLNGYDISKSGWMTEMNSMTLTTIPDINNNWVRSSDGNQNAMVFKWTSTLHLDSEISLVAWDLNKEISFTKVSATVLGVTFVTVDQSEAQFRRIGNPFFKVGGAEISDQPTNHLQITGTEKSGSSPVTAGASFYMVKSINVEVKYNYQCPYTDIFPGSFFTVPFFNENVVQGNNIEWRIDYSSATNSSLVAAFGKTNIVDEFSPEVNLSPMEPRYGWAKVAISSGFFVAQDRGSIVSIYSCNYPNMHTQGCNRLQTQKLIDGEMMQGEIYGKGDIVMFWTTNGKLNPPRSNVYVCDINQGCTKNKLPAAANSVTFFEDGYDHFLVGVARYTPEDQSNGIIANGSPCLLYAHKKSTLIQTLPESISFLTAKLIWEKEPTLSSLSMLLSQDHLTQSHHTHLPALSQSPEQSDIHLSVLWEITS